MPFRGHDQKKYASLATLAGMTFSSILVSENTLAIFSPALREQSFLARKQSYLRAVESIIGLKRGLLSEVEEVERTAKEIISSAGGL